MTHHFSRRLVVALLALLAFAGTATSAAAQDKLDHALRDGKRAGKSQHVIVKAKPGYEAWARHLLAQQGKAIDAELPSIGGLAVELSASELDLCKSAVFDGCSEDSYVSTTASATRTTTSRRNNKTTTTTLAKVAYSAPAVNTLLGTLGLTPSTSFGRGVTVAVIDSGIYPSPAFGRRIKAFYDFTTGGIRARFPYDDYGHGTHVAGLIGGLQSSDLEYQGVAPSVEFVGLKVLDKNGGGKTSDVIRAIEFAVANKTRFGIDIINLSLGHPIYEPAATDPLVQAVEKATKAGIIVVASAGNNGVNPKGEIGYAGITSPGNAPSAITVGAADHKATITRDDDRMAIYSSNGPTWYDGLVKPDFVAPGHFLASEAAPGSSLFKTYPSLHKKGPSGKDFMALSGTSMSAAVVSGVVAVLKQARYDLLTPNLAKAVLQFTAIPMKDDNGVTYGPLRQGTGEINARGAMNVVSEVDTRITDVKTPWISIAPYTTIGNQTYQWASNIVWGDNIVWGESIYYNLPIYGLNIVWGDNIVWGENLLQPLNVQNRAFNDDNIVWGNLNDDNIVWGNSAEDNIVWGNNDDNIVWGNAVLVSGKGGK